MGFNYSILNIVLENYLL